MLLCCVTLAGCLSLCLGEKMSPGDVPGHAGYYFFESFESRDAFDKRWVKSNATKSGNSSVTYDGKWELFQVDETQYSNGMVLHVPEASQHYAISALLDRAFVFKNKPLILQYEFKLPKNIQCGGAYVKLLSTEPSTLHHHHHHLAAFRDDSPYSIMFGPDKCGQTRKMHFIFRHKNPRTMVYEEKHLVQPEDKKFAHIFTDGHFHQIKLVLRPDNSFDLLLDKQIIAKGSLLDSFEPPVNPPKEIDDPEDRQPDNWDSRPKIPDPTATKPLDWNDKAPKMIIDPKAKKPSNWLDNEDPYVPDPNASKPNDWHEEQDGEWEPPLISNPKCNGNNCGHWDPPQIFNPVYRGEWMPPLIDNPAYKGKYSPRLIPNPNYFLDNNPFEMDTVVGIGFEIWTTDANLYFDSILITSQNDVSLAITANTFDRNLSKRRLNYITGVVKSPIFMCVCGSFLLVALSLIVFRYYSSRRCKAVKTAADSLKNLQASESSEEKDHKMKTESELDSMPQEESDEDPLGRNLRKRPKPTAPPPETD